MKFNFAVFLFPLSFMVSPLHAAALWTTTFSGTVNTAGDASRVVTNTPMGDFTDLLAPTTSTLTRSSATGNFFLTGTGNTLSNYNPNQNVDNASGASWSAVFDYGTGVQTITLTDVVFNVYRFNSAGAVQGPEAPPIKVRDVNISAEYTLNGGTTWLPVGATQTVDLTPSLTATPNIALTFSPGAAVSVNLASDDFRIRYSVVNTGIDTGAFNGISSIVFNGSVVPEPSIPALAALAGLALLRRRHIRQRP